MLKWGNCLVVSPFFSTFALDKNKTTIKKQIEL